MFPISNFTEILLVEASLIYWKDRQTEEHDEDTRNMRILQISKRS